MRIDLDCARDVMLCVEENTGLHRSCYFLDYALNAAAEFVGDIEETPSYQAELEKKYANETLLYHLNYCIEAGLLTSSTPTGTYLTVISDLTPKGHEFLANIRNQNVWAKVRGLARKAGSTGIDFVIEIAKAVSVEAAKSILLTGQ